MTATESTDAGSEPIAACAPWPSTRIVPFAPEWFVVHVANPALLAPVALVAVVHEPAEAVVAGVPLPHRTLVVATATS